MPKREFDFRWGIPVLDDKGYTHIYGFMLRNYHRIGVTRNEFLFIVHLSGFKYDTEHGEAHPSLKTIAALMGYAKDDSVRELVASLEKKGMLTVQRNEGFTSTYDFGGFSKACIDAEMHPDQVPHPSGVPPHSGGESPITVGTNIERENRERDISDTLAEAPAVGVSGRANLYGLSPTDLDPLRENEKSEGDSTSDRFWTELELKIMDGTRSKELTEDMLKKLNREQNVLDPSSGKSFVSLSANDLYVNDSLYRKWFTDILKNDAKNFQWKRSDFVSGACNLKRFYTWRKDQYDPEAAAKSAFTGTDDERFDVKFPGRK